MSKAYKDSGIPWIGMIPSDWCLLHFKYSGSFEKGKLPNSTNVDGKGFPIIGASEMNGKPPTLFTEQQDIPMCGNEDVLILWDGANAGLVANNLQGIVSSTVVKYSCNDNRCNVQYVYYQYKTLERYFKSKVSGTTIPHMNMKFINGSPMLLPPLPTQQRIADFPDRKCAEIDELAALQETMIAELKRYKQSVITEAVTKGLDPNVPMKDSGVEWIGEIPEWWEVCRLKNFVEITDGTHDTPDYVEPGENTYPLVTSKCIVDGNIDVSIANHISETDYKEIIKRSCVKKYDVIMPMIGTVGNPSVKMDDTEIAIKNVALFRTKGDYYKGQYLKYILNSNVITEQFRSQNRGGVQNFVSQNTLRELIIILPNNIVAVVNYLDEKCAEIDELIAIKQQKIEALKEYKKSVIFEYVTGKKEVEE